jgi:hypothetical protein
LPHDDLLVTIGMQILNIVMEGPLCVSCNKFVALLIEVPLDSLLAAVDTHVAGKSEVKEKKKL